MSQLHHESSRAFIIDDDDDDDDDDEFYLANFSHVRYLSVNPDIFNCVKHCLMC